MKTLMRNGRDRRSENPSWATAKKERVVMLGTDQRITSGPAAKRLHSKAGYMAAPERFAESQILFPCTAGAVHTWPTAEMTAADRHGRLLGYCGRHRWSALRVPRRCGRAHGVHTRPPARRRRRLPCRGAAAPTGNRATRWRRLLADVPFWRMPDRGGRRRRASRRQAA